MASGELARLGRDFRSAGDKIERNVKKAVRGTGARTERYWRLSARITARKHGKHYPGAVTHDEMVAGDWITTEVGPDKTKRQGALGNLLEFGSRNNPAHRDGEIAMMVEEPRFLRNMEKAGDVDI